MKFVALVAASAGLAALHAPLESVRLHPLHGSGVHGTISFQGAGEGTAVWVRLAHLPAGAAVRVLLHAGTCARHGASFALAASGRATSTGSFVAHGRVLFHGRPVAPDTIADGDHVFVVTSSGAERACAVVPGIG